MRRVTDRLGSSGLGLKAAFEIEWVVSRGDDAEFRPATQGPGFGMSRIIETSD